MNATEELTAERVSDLVLANRVIRAPYYEKAHDEGVQFTDRERGLQWGADVVPGLLGLFRVERASGDEGSGGFVGFARHWRGGTLRIEFDRFAAADESDPVLVVTTIAGREGTRSIEDEDFGKIELPEEVPTEDDWEDRDTQYHRARRNDDTDGAASVAAYIGALPGWKREVATRFDEIVRSELPEVRSAVRYHQPFYGVEDEGWFASFSAFSQHVKLSFVSGSYLEPKPPSGTGPDRQALDVTETDSLDEKQVASWVRQAADDPGMNW